MFIVGGGIIGLTCGWRLAQKGRRVTIFDSREVAREASWAGAGMLAPGGEVEEGSAFTRMALDSLAQYPDFVAELEEASGLPIDYQRRGAIELALTDAEAEALERRAELQYTLGIDSEATAYKGSVSARFYKNDQVVAPRDLTKALHVACLRAGVSIHENEPVRQLMPDGSGVTTASGDYSGDGVIIAAGAWSSGLRPGLPVTVPVRGHLISYETGFRFLDAILRHQRTYLLQRSGGTVIAGTSTEYVGFDRTIDEAVVSDLHRRALRLLPELSAFTPAERWNGFRPGVEGECPVVGRIEGTSIWTAFGHYRNGILLAPETARMIARSVDDVG